MARVKTLFAHLIIMATASVAPCLSRVVEVQLSETVLLQGISSLLLCIDYYLIENYYLSPVLAILLLLVFTPLKNDIIPYVDNIHQFIGFFSILNLIIKYLAFCNKNVFGNHT